ncbi:hypothetical protein ACFE04_015674 [Oxalis oulophora]
MVYDKSSDFSISGPLHLTAIDWRNAHHRRSISACLVQGVYVLEMDRQFKRLGTKALAPPWWEFFHFKVFLQLLDDDDSSIFGVVFEYKPKPSSYYNKSMDQSPRYVIAFRGTLTKLKSFQRDLELDVHIFRNKLHETSRCKIAVQAVQEMVAAAVDSIVWLAGHSLGAALAMLAGKSMAKTNNYLQTFLFNSPFSAAPIEKIIKDRKVTNVIRMGRSVIKSGLAHSIEKMHKNETSLALQSQNLFSALASWVPHLFVNGNDPISCEYIGYFAHRITMEEMGLGGIDRIATQHSYRGLLMSALGKHSEPMHLIPSANVTINVRPPKDILEAHGIQQWWKPDIDVQSKVHMYMYK